MRERSDRNDSKIRNGIRQAFVVEWERATDNYGTRLFVAKRSSAGSCKIIRLEVCHQTITD
ncbi:hypothetical protein KZY63_11320 [Prevotella histicola]|uniref:hypothetical protein n=1 Tax=Prevotella histicola TaxID=470565 RepID=UPI001C5E2F2C|nr:hypothetical protein [Prevotella histicola]MBW4713023.1 hypothetical protein [Prevotella histicola]MBW4877806.1 hypothetical protein [Prevotella histicola]MBW4921787.1 hypothetical protein [Prevotella histicola]